MKKVQTGVQVTGSSALSKKAIAKYTRAARDHSAIEAGLREAITLWYEDERNGVPVAQRRALPRSHPAYAAVAELARDTLRYGSGRKADPALTKFIWAQDPGFRKHPLNYPTLLFQADSAQVRLAKAAKELIDLHLSSRTARGRSEAQALIGGLEQIRPGALFDSASAHLGLKFVGSLSAREKLIWELGFHTGTGTAQISSKLKIPYRGGKRSHLFYYTFFAWIELQDPEGKMSRDLRSKNSLHQLIEMMKKSGVHEDGDYLLWESPRGPRRTKVSSFRATLPQWKREFKDMAKP